MSFGGFWRRFGAYLIDIILIAGCVTAVFYFFLGFDETFKKRLDLRNVEARRQFIKERNQIRNVSLAIYLAYCGVLEASALRGTIGKRLLGMVVVTEEGAQLTYAQSAQRSLAKSLSFALCGLGCLCIAWSPTKQGWHDRRAGTFVVCRRGA